VFSPFFLKILKTSGKKQKRVDAAKAAGVMSVKAFTEEPTKE